MSNIVDLTGLKNEKWEVLSRTNNRRWVCVCVDCGCKSTRRRCELARSCRLCCNTPKGELGFRTLYRAYKNDAKQRGLCFHLTPDVFRRITSGNCFYCGIEPQQKRYSKHRKTDYGLYFYNGIDRVDNSVGYIEDNCVPCCGICNNAKRSLTQQQFLDWMARLLKYQKK